MNNSNLENQMFLLSAIQKTNKYFGDDDLIESENEEIHKIDHIFYALKNMENELTRLSRESCMSI